MRQALTSANIGSVAQMQRLLKIRYISTTFNIRQHHQKYQAITHERSAIRNFSGYGHLRNKQQNNDELPSFSFEGLGMSRNAKIFVIVVLSIFGTIETWVWCKGIYRWWNGSPEKEKKQA